MEKLKFILLRGMQNGTLALENSLVVPQKFKHNYHKTLQFTQEKWQHVSTQKPVHECSQQLYS